MVDHCPHCQRKIVKWPLKDGRGKIIWKNLFKIDVMSLFFLISILLLLVAYGVNTEECRGIVEDPCTFCEGTGAEVYVPSEYIKEIPPDITELDISGK